MALERTVSIGAHTYALFFFDEARALIGDFAKFCTCKDQVINTRGIGI